MKITLEKIAEMRAANNNTGWNWLANAERQLEDTVIPVPKTSGGSQDRWNRYDQKMAHRRQCLDAIRAK